MIFNFFDNKTRFVYMLGLGHQNSSCPIKMFFFISKEKSKIVMCDA